MSENTNLVFPIHRLNQRVSEKLAKIVSADIPGNINKGLQNEVNFIDEGTGMTDCAYINRNALTNKVYVTMSAAFMQYVWLLNDIALKSIDLGTIMHECRECRLDIKDYVKASELVAKMTPEELLTHVQLPEGVDPNQYIDYIKRTLPLLNEVEFEKKWNNEALLIERLLDKNEKFTPKDFGDIDLNGGYEETVNGVYCYSIAFTMLHELSHFELGHLDTNDEKLEDEQNADLNAFWCVFCDLDEAEKFTAMVGILCLLFALLMLNPTMKEDGVHPREDKRIFEIYDNIASENPKYTVLLVSMFSFWAKVNNIVGFPDANDDSENSLNQIRTFITLNL